MLRTFRLATALLLLATGRLLAAWPHVAIVADTSGSMATNDKLHALQEGAKLAISLVDGEVIIVPFNSHATVSSSLKLSNHDSRRAAMAYIEVLKAGGDTNYLAPLSRLTQLPRGTPSVFISDGENRRGSDADVLALVAKAPGPIHAIAVNASGPAQELLTEIAAKSGGSAVSVDDAEGLTKALLAIAQRLGGYHAHTPSEDTLRFSNCLDSVIAIGYDALPSMTGSPSFRAPPFQHRARLRTEHVLLSRVRLASPTALEIRSLHKRNPTGRLARVLRSDLVQPVLRVPTADGTVPAGGELQVATDLIDREGERVDPRTRPDIQVEYGLQDADNNTIVQKPAIPAPDGLSLTATLPVPDKAGPITVTQIASDLSSGLPFFAEDQQTVIAVEPIRLVVSPARLELSPRQGSFTAELHVKLVDGGDERPGGFSAHLVGTPEHLVLVSTESNGALLKIDFRADRPGTYGGELVIDGNAAVPIAPLKIAYRFRVRPLYLGLALPASHDVNLGTLVANSGPATVANWQVPGLDGDSVPTVEVHVTDLANGSSVIPLRADHATIAPAQGKRAPLKLLADIGNVPADVYRGSVTFGLAGASDDRRWRANVHLTVTEPLSASPLDFGKVEVGRTVKRKLSIRNAAAQVPNVTILLTPFARHGSRLDPADISLSLPDRIPVIAAKSETAVDIALTVSPLLESRGKYQASLQLQRTDSQQIAIPVRLEIVGEGKKASALLASPEALRLRAAPGSVVKLEVRVKLATANAGLIELSAKPTTFEDPTGGTHSIDMDVVFPNGKSLSAQGPLIVQGFVIAPEIAGSYRGGVLLRSSSAGTKLIPVTLDVVQGESK